MKNWRRQSRALQSQRKGDCGLLHRFPFWGVAWINSLRFCERIPTATIRRCWYRHGWRNVIVLCDFWGVRGIASGDSPLNMQLFLPLSSTPCSVNSDQFVDPQKSHKAKFVVLRNFYIKFYKTYSTNKNLVPLKCVLPPKPQNLATGLYSPLPETNALRYACVCLCHESPSHAVCLKPLCLPPYPQVHQIDENSKSRGYQKRRTVRNWWWGACQWRILWHKRRWRRRRYELLE